MKVNGIWNFEISPTERTRRWLNTFNPKSKQSRENLSSNYRNLYEEQMTSPRRTELSKELIAKAERGQWNLECDERLLGSMQNVANVSLSIKKPRPGSIKLSFVTINRRSKVAVKPPGPTWRRWCSTATRPAWSFKILRESTLCKTRTTARIR